MRRCWVNFQCRGVLLICMIVGRGPTALAVGAGGGCLDIFTLIYPFPPLSPSLRETARYRLKYCLKGPFNPKQPTNQLNVAKISSPKYFYFGDRRSQVLHTRLRTKCSSLNHDLFLKRITDTPLCRCGSVENTQHFFMTCYLYRAERNELFAAISKYCQVSMDTLLYGNNTLSNEIKSDLFAAVHKYIHDTKRF